MKKFIQAFAITLLLTSCLADLRTDLVKENGTETSNITKGKTLLGNTIKTQGMDKLSNHSVYSFTGQDNWRGFFGKTGKLWPNVKANIEFKYRINTFDGQVKFLDGKRKGDVAGLQNWKYYEITNKTDTNFLKTNKKISFGIPAIQYFSEISTRLQKAELVTYAGTDSFLEKEYDLVHCTWKSLEPTKEMDQYVVWINKKTNIIDFVQYTIRDAGKFFSGTIQYDNYEIIEGIQFPMEQTVYPFKMKKNKKKNIHQLKISNIKLDGFSPVELIVDQTVGVGGDVK